MSKSKPKKLTHHLMQLGSGSLAVILPKALVRSLGWKERQRVLVKRMPRGILIRDALTRQRKRK